MQETFTIDVLKQGVKGRNGKVVTTTLVVVNLLQHGSVIAVFDNIDIAQRCANLLNEHGVL